MFDFRKIDAFFNGEKPFEEKGGQSLTRRAKMLRGAKLLMPSLAALLIGLLLLFPSLKKDNMITELDVTLPKKGELEKIHIEQTEFSVTDKDNQVSSFTADQIDETQPGSNVVKIISPKGKIPEGNGEKFINITSHTGYYNQSYPHLKLERQIKAVYDDGTTVLTDVASYDFKKAYGVGDKPVHAFGDWGKLWSEGFELFKDKDLLILKGKSKIINSGQTMWADKQVRYYRLENRIEAEYNVKIVSGAETLYTDKMVAFLTKGKKLQIEKIKATGKVKLIDGNKTLYADKMDAFLAPGEKMQIKKIEAVGNVKVVEENSTVYADKMNAFFSAKDNLLEKIEAFNNVRVETPDGVATGDYGLYLPEKSELELHNNVTITQNGNIIRGQKAITNLKTSVSRVIADPKAGGKVSGVIRGSTVKDEKNEKK